MSINLKFIDMKIMIHIFLVFIAMQSITNAQCGINYKEILKKNCSGVYLRHQDYNNLTGGDIKLVLTKDNKYAIYLLNPSESLPRLNILDSNHFPLQDYAESVNADKNTALYTFKVNETSEYGFELDFNTDEKACVLLAIYLQNDKNYKAGVYKNFDEFKYGNPSIEFNGQLLSKKKNYGKRQLYSYKLEMKNKNQKSQDKVFGFSDGKDIYINITYPKLNSNAEFVKMEYLYKYCYFEYIKNIPVYSSPTVIIVPSLKQKLLDINTGEVIVLNKQSNP